MRWCFLKWNENILYKIIQKRYNFNKNANVSKFNHVILLL